MNVHPNPNLPGGDRANVSPTPEGGDPAVGTSPAHGRVTVERPLIALAVLAASAIGLRVLLAWLQGVAPNQSPAGVADFQLAGNVVGLVVILFVAWLVAPLVSDARDGVAA